MKIISCKFCNSNNIVKKGLRRLKNKNKQIYLCKNCNKRFSEGISKKTFDIKTILNAVNAYNQGYNYKEVCDLISRKNKTIISKSSIDRWVKEYSLGYSNIKSRIIKKYGFNLIIGRMFKHSGLLYNFKYHKGKLNLFCKFQGLKNFITNLSKGVDDKLFNFSENRCSTMKSDVCVNIKTFDNTNLNENIGHALKSIKSNKQRHSIIENFMLNCDRDTIATEVPVWYWDKRKNIGIHGHIDILQVKYGKIWILDYKPNAHKENINKVVSQLWNYARALSFRSNVNLNIIKCGWFDENKTFIFNPNKVKFKK